jgi:hypothetical protein
VIAVLLALVTLGPAAPVAAAPGQDDCPVVTLPGEECEVTTTTEDIVTTTEQEAEATTTTERSTATTRPTATTTAAEDEETSTSLTEETTVDLLVPGDGTEGAESTTTTVAIASTGDGGPSDGTLIALVIVGLVLIAGVVTVLTWRYWVATRPPLLERGAARGR